MNLNNEDIQRTFDKLKAHAPKDASVCLTICVWRYRHSDEDCSIHYSAYISLQTGAVISTEQPSPEDAVSIAIEKLERKMFIKEEDIDNAS